MDLTSGDDGAPSAAATVPLLSDDDDVTHVVVVRGAADARRAGAAPSNAAPARTKSFSSSPRRRQRPAPLRPTSSSLPPSPSTRCRACLPPALTVAFCALLVGGGLFLVFPAFHLPSGWGGASLRDTFSLPEPAATYAGYALLGASALLPLVALVVCVVAATPGKTARQRDAVYSDALLEERVSSAQALAQVVDLFPPTTATMKTRGGDSDDDDADDEEMEAPARPTRPRKGTIVLLSGAGAPRSHSHPIAEACADQGYTCVCVDLPGHGSLSSVTFSLVRSERVLGAVIERELAAARAEAAAVTAASHAATTGTSRGVVVRHPPSVLDRTAPAAYGAGTGSGRGSVVLEIEASLAGGESPLLPLPHQRASPGGVPGRAASQTVILASYGAASHVAALYALRHPSQIAGVAMLGPIPDYERPSLRTSLSSSLFRLRWVCALANLSLKGRIQASMKALDADKHALLASDFNHAVIPNYIREVRELAATGGGGGGGGGGAAGSSSSGPRRGSAVARLRLLNRPLLFLCRESRLPAARALVGSAPLASFVSARGIKHPILHSLSRAKTDAVAAAIASFAADAYAFTDDVLVVEESAAEEAAAARRSFLGGGGRSGGGSSGGGGGGGRGAGGRGSSLGTRDNSPGSGGGQSSGASSSYPGGSSSRSSFPFGPGPGSGPNPPHTATASGASSLRGGGGSSRQPRSSSLRSGGSGSARGSLSVSFGGDWGGR
jgi:pimeloyl-ACP methyl ester carboxylesterase